MYFVSSTEKSYGFIREHDGQLLHISKPDGEIHIERGNYPGANSAGLRRIDGILGIIRLRMAKYIIVITKSHIVGRIHEHQIMQADEYDLLPLREWRVKDENEICYIDMVKRHLNNGSIFFCNTFDLTNAFQRQSDSREFWKVADTRFFWNHYISQDFIDAAAQSDPVIGEFILPCIYGVVSLHETTINQSPVTFGIITRRSRFRAGTRYFRRGIDLEGNVANFNETEQILMTPNKIYSFVQTRGSVPVYWGEINNLQYKPMLRVGSGGSGSIDAAEKHFDEQVNIYGKNYLVNLVNQKGYELPVKQAYEDMVRNLDRSNKDIEYVYFDFHHECSKMRWQRVDLLIGDLETRGLDEQYWFQASYSATLNGKQKQIGVERNQHSVVRTNCMDCLDRTNVVQSQIAKFVLQRQLVDANIISSNQHWETMDSNFLFIFRNTWADNADGVSCAYSGTGALKTDFTRLGKRTKMGALSDLKNSIVRYVRNNFYDGPRQDAYDLFLGNHLPFESVDPPFGDLRPLWVQSVPYLMLGSTVMIAAGTFFPKQDAPLWVNRAFLVFWCVVWATSFKSLMSNGLQYVNWPRLAPLDFIGESESVVNGETKGWMWAERQKESKSNKYNPRGLEEGKQE